MLESGPKYSKIKHSLIRYFINCSQIKWIKGTLILTFSQNIELEPSESYVYLQIDIYLDCCLHFIYDLQLSIKYVTLSQRGWEFEFSEDHCASSTKDDHDLLITNGIKDISLFLNFSEASS